MSESRRLQKLIKESTASLQKYREMLLAEPNDFGAKLMVGNIQRHIYDLENQVIELRFNKNESSPAGKGNMAAASSF